jgi:hypothetical protein
VIRPRADRIARAIDASRKAKWARTRFEDDRHPDTIGPVLGDPDRCWCGAVYIPYQGCQGDGALHPGAAKRPDLTWTEPADPAKETNP